MDNKEELKRGENTGFIPVRNDADYVFGGVTKIQHEDRNTTGDWRSFLPLAERQSGRYFDTMGCVTFSAMNSLECQIRWMLANKLVGGKTLVFLRDNGYLDGQDTPNFSDRFIVVMSKTGPTGNSLQAVWDAIDTYGLVPETVWPNNLENFKRTEYFAQPTAAVKALGLQFKEHFKTQYEFLQNRSQLAQALRHAPIQLASGTCPGWNSDSPVKTCSMGANHATIITAVGPEGIHDFDHYEPFEKLLSPTYELPFLLKGILTPKIKDDGAPRPSTDFHFNRDLVQGETSIDVKFLQERLGVLTPPTGYYGNLTVAAVRELMYRENIGSFWEKSIWPAGRRVGSKIRAFLNT